MFAKFKTWMQRLSISWERLHDGITRHNNGDETYVTLYAIFVIYLILPNNTMFPHIMWTFIQTLLHSMGNNFSFMYKTEQNKAIRYTWKKILRNEKKSWRQRVGLSKNKSLNYWGLYSYCRNNKDASCELYKRGLTKTNN